jgi:DNA (cytosine-5)-methyltransferase 1
MLTPQLLLGLADELVIDLFAGGGGASTGIEQAIGRHVDIAVNHDPLAIAQHFANHPQTRHYCEDVFDVDPIAVTEGRPVGLLWASPDCKHFSKAKGGKPRSKKIRALADIIAVWAETVRPRIICMENVEEFKTWGELDEDGHPIPELRGLLFERWKARILAQGYTGEFRELRAANHKTPTIRKRLIGIFRCDGQPIVWPAATNAKNPPRGSGLKPWRTAAECINFGVKAESIFDRKRALVKNTHRRVARGLWRHVLTNAGPYFVEQPGQHLAAPFLNEHANSSNDRTMAADEPMRTLCAEVKRGHFSLITPTLAVLRGTSDAHLGNAHSVDEPLTTLSAGGTHHALVAAHLVTIGYGERQGQEARTNDIRTPTGTAVAGGIKQAVVLAFMEQANGGFFAGDGRSLNDPISTITAAGTNQQLVTAYCIKYYGSGGQWQGLSEPLHTQPAKGRMGLVDVRQVPLDAIAPEHRRRAKQCADLLREHLPEHFSEEADAVLVWQRGLWWVLVDITLRMLRPRELYLAQGFRGDYIIDWGLEFTRGPGGLAIPTGNRIPLTAEQQIRSCGNSVCPPLAEAVIGANYRDASLMWEAA